MDQPFGIWDHIWVLDELGQEDKENVERRLFILSINSTMKEL